MNHDAGMDQRPADPIDTEFQDQSRDNAGGISRKDPVLSFPQTTDTVQEKEKDSPPCLGMMVTAFVPQ